MEDSTNTFFCPPPTICICSVWGHRTKDYITSRSFTWNHSTMHHLYSLPLGTLGGLQEWCVYMHASGEGKDEERGMGEWTEVEVNRDDKHEQENATDWGCWENSQTVDTLHKRTWLRTAALSCPPHYPHSSYLFSPSCMSHSPSTCLLIFCTTNYFLLPTLWHFIPSLSDM